MVLSYAGIRTPVSYTHLVVLMIITKKSYWCCIVIFSLLFKEWRRIPNAYRNRGQNQGSLCYSESKRHSTQWHHPHSPSRSQNYKQAVLILKVMATVVLGQKIYSLLNVCLMEPPVNNDTYCEAYIKTMCRRPVSYTHLMLVASLLRAGA